MNGGILGIPGSAMEARLDEIAAFADIGEFFDQPVKLYSSGMFLRLAFAVATSVDADIVLIDEALAVGDVFFQQKCYRRLEALRDHGVTVLLVSHAMPDVEQFCQRAILLDRGQVAFLGPAAEAVRRYYLLDQSARCRPSGRRPNAAPPARDPGEPAASRAGPPRRRSSTSRPWTRPRTGGPAARGSRCATERAGRGTPSPRAGWRGFSTSSSCSGTWRSRSAAWPSTTARPCSSTAATPCSTTARAPVRRRGERIRFRQDVRLDLGLDEYTLEVAWPRSAGSTSSGARSTRRESCIPTS